ncbi:methyltransferase domain-containing protein [Streptomyces sp. NBC_00414]|uniref:class I SAM-dependent DNA methyltransferase n=1 Tax=Streptomyces sp. NBC_00414 TaxID=2975739 RepID=UPI002E1DA2F2
MIEPDFLRTTRTAYDAMAERYAELFADGLEEFPLDRAMLAVFADFVRTDGGGPVADLGCGPGHVTSLLDSLGLDVSGVDLSPEMVAIARAARPDLRFEVGSMTALDLPDDSLGGVLARYSIIHTPPEQLPRVFTEFHRVLASGGRLMLAFQAHDDPSELAESFDHKVALAYRWSPDRVCDLLAETGFTETARLVRAPLQDERPFPHAHLLLSKN